MPELENMATETDEDEEDIGGGKRERSPNYPALTFTAALERAEKIWKKEKRNPVSQEVAARHLDYKKMNGASYQVIGALKRYGLAVPSGKDIRISDDAHFIFVHPDGHPDRVATMRRLALSPALFGKILAAFPDGLPSDENLVAKLQTDTWGFKSEDAAKAVVRALRDALRLQSQEVADPQPDDGINANIIKKSPDHISRSSEMKARLSPPPIENNVISRQWEISEGRFATVTLPQDPTVDDVENLEEFLSLLKQELALVWKRKARTKDGAS